MPDNYLDLFENLLQLNSSWVSGLVLLDNLDTKTTLQSIALPFLGAKDIGLQLLRNIVELPLRKREKVFKNLKIPVLNWQSMNSKEAIDYVLKNKIDLIVNLRTRCIYKKEILNAPKIGCLNIHHGLLPDYRGTFCDLYALTEGRKAGFSIHEMVEKIDAGKLHKVVPVASKEEIKIKNKYSYLNYLKKTAQVEAKALYELCLEIDKRRSFPEGEPNITEKKIFTKNPTKKQIKEFINQGFVL
ncbi:MAG: methionyl-tRNA formyltransferase [Bacteriovoracaceae bacterium]|jgi:methionyl-tRNA formyltransferase